MSEQDLSALAGFAEASPTGVALVDESGLVVLANSALCLLLERPRAELEGLPLG